MPARIYKFAVILPAGGSSARFGSDKLSADLNGKSVLERTIEAFVNRDDVAQIILAGRSINPSNPKVKSVSGGECRAATVLNGLHAVDPSIEWVAIHDAARPLISQELIDRVLEAALEFGAAGPALPVNLTIRRAIGPLPAKAQATVDRGSLWAMQTPQAGRRSILLEAFDKCLIPLEEITDDLQLIEMLGLPVQLVPGEQRNIKLTNPLDLMMARLQL
jgi:2-C-methyl-D-erythritol 4-phosphate cytidylyltransferase